MQVRLMNVSPSGLATITDTHEFDDAKSISAKSIGGYSTVLRQTRVYRNPRLWDPETRSVFTSERGGTTWTALSSATLADVASIICVISLPLPGERLFQLDKIIEDDVHNLGIAPSDITVKSLTASDALFGKSEDYEPTVLSTLADTLISLHYAINLGNLTTVHSLLEPKSPEDRDIILNVPLEGTFRGFNGKMEAFNLPLQYAIRQGQSLMAKALLEYGAELIGAQSLLEHVAWRYDPAMLRVILEHAAKLEPRTKTTLFRVIDILLPLAVSYNSPDMVALLLHYRLYIPHMTDAKIRAGNHTLNQCLRDAVQKQLAGVVTKLLEKDANPNLSEQSMEKSLLAEAVYADNYHLVAVLLKFGAKPNMYRPDWNPILYWAFYNSKCSPNLKVITRLLESGAHVNISYKPGPRQNMPIMQLAYRMVPPKLHTTIIQLLLWYSPDVSATDHLGNSILHTVCDSETPNYKLLELLIDRVTDVNAVNLSGQTALHLFCDKHYFCDKKTDTPHIHVEWIACIATLLKAGADETIVDNNKFTPFSLMVPLSKCLQDAKDMVLKWRAGTKTSTHEYDIPEPMSEPDDDEDDELSWDDKPGALNPRNGIIGGPWLSDIDTQCLSKIGDVADDDDVEAEGNTQPMNFMDLTGKTHPRTYGVIGTGNLFPRR